MKMTTPTGITCPNCKEDFDVETEGLFGGIFKQMIKQSILNRVKEEGADAICGYCNHKFYVPPQ